MAPLRGTGGLPLEKEDPANVESMDGGNEGSDKAQDSKNPGNILARLALDHVLAEVISETTRENAGALFEIVEEVLTGIREAEAFGKPPCWYCRFRRGSWNAVKSSTIANRIGNAIIAANLTEEEAYISVMWPVFEFKRSGAARALEHFFKKGASDV